MLTTTEIDTLDRLLDPVRRCLSVEVASRIASLRAEDSVQHRLDDLAERHREGRLTMDELAELTALVQACNMIAVLQAKARAALATG